MGYFPDLTPYSHLTQELIDGHLNVGWLDAAQPFEVGPTPAEFHAKLFRLCMHPFVPTRGIHACPFCRLARSDRPLEASRDGRSIWLGNAELVVPAGTEGRFYRAPNLVYHYVVEHSYRPPQEFIDAVMACEVGWWLRLDPARVEAQAQQPFKGAATWPARLLPYLALVIVAVLGCILVAAFVQVLGGPLSVNASIAVGAISGVLISVVIALIDLRRRRRLLRPILPRATTTPAADAALVYRFAGSQRVAWLSVLSAAVCMAVAFGLDGYVSPSMQSRDRANFWKISAAVSFTIDSMFSIAVTLFALFVIRTIPGGDGEERQTWRTRLPFWVLTILLLAVMTIGETKSYTTDGMPIRQAVALSAVIGSCAMLLAPFLARVSQREWWLTLAYPLTLRGLRRWWPKEISNRCGEISFQGVQDGVYARVLKGRFAYVAASNRNIVRAYLAVVQYADRADPFLALCVRTYQPIAHFTREQFGRAFASIGLQNAMIDLVELTEAEEVRLDEQFPAFYDAAFVHPAARPKPVGAIAPWSVATFHPANADRRHAAFMTAVGAIVSAIGFVGIPAAKPVPWLFAIMGSGVVALGLAGLQDPRIVRAAYRPKDPDYAQTFRPLAQKFIGAGLAIGLIVAMIVYLLSTSR